LKKTLSTGADVPGKDIENSTILEILLASHKILETPNIFATTDSTKKPGLSGLIPDVW
jgi:hypothetical protein